MTDDVMRKEPITADVSTSDEHAQPMPVRNDRPSIQSLVRADLDAREQVGVSRYGTSLQAHNGRDMLRDAYDEAMDLTTYLRGVIEERGTSLADLVEPAARSLHALQCFDPVQYPGECPDPADHWTAWSQLAEAALQPFAPVLAERDKLREQVQLLGRTLQQSAYTDKDTARLAAEIEEAKAELAKLSPESTWKYPPSLMDRVHIVRLDLDAARMNVARLLGEREAGWIKAECKDPGVGLQSDTENASPRVFPVGSAEPGPEVRAVRSNQNQVVFERTGERWLATAESGGDGQFYWWHQLNGGRHAAGDGMQLTEVIKDQPGGES